MDPVQEREGVLATLQDSVGRLETSLHVQLIPEEGVSFGFALRGARDKSGVAAIPGGIKTDAGKPKSAGPGAFGTEEPAVRIILTMMKFDPSMRSAALIRYTDRTFSILEDDLFLECASLTTGGRDRGISTLDWGIASCCKKGIPDVIHMKNPDKNHSRLIICGEDPADVANNIIICSNRI
jgi:thiamine-phosphate diphosphorylase